MGIENLPVFEGRLSDGQGVDVVELAQILRDDGISLICYVVGKMRFRDTDTELSIATIPGSLTIPIGSKFLTSALGLHLIAPYQIRDYKILETYKAGELQFRYPEADELESV